MKRKIVAVLIAIFTSTILYAQQYSITGTVSDAGDKSSLTGITITISPANDTGNKQGTVTDTDGFFSIDNVKTGRYILKASSIGYNSFTKTVIVTNANMSVGAIQLTASSSTLKNVTVSEKQIRVQQMGDTTQFNADAYKTNPDANTEDLVTKMPGVTTTDGKLKVNGEDIKQILVDGKPFFGDDPAAAIKNLPAEVVDKIQVFDRLSEQAQFTGFDDGQSQKTINIITRAGKNNGQFGKLYAGYGTDDRYIAGGNINLFKGSRRISLLALSNNVNQQNFSTEDLTGALGTTSGQNRGGGQFRGGGQGGQGRGGQGGGGNDINNFLVGQQGGITGTHALGLNYSDNWGKKIKISGSYFFNATDNNNNTTLNRTYLTARDNNLLYAETTKVNSQNINHRFNLRWEYEIDSFNAIVLTPRISLQYNNNNNTVTGLGTTPNGFTFGKTDNYTTANNNAINFGNNLLYRHKFAKKGRTLSLNVNTQINNRDGDGTNYLFYKLLADTTLLDQQYTLITKGYTIAPGINYTEPIGKKGILMLNYSPSYTNNQSDKQTNNRNTLSNQYTDFDTLLSNQYDNTNTRHRGGAGYRFNDKKTSFNIGADAQYTTLDGTQYFPTAFNINKTFTNILPNAMYNYRLNTAKNLRIMYRTNTDVPSISQLQNVVDISNPLLLKTGNPDLKQSYSHTLSMRYSATNAKKATSFFIFAFANYVNNFIGNASFIPNKDTIVNNYAVNRGSQISLPVNLDGNVNARTFATYGFPLSLIKSNLNLNAGFNYTRTPALINNNSNYNNNYGITGGLTIGSNISENIDFTVAYSGNYNIVENTLQTQANNSYYTQNTSLKFNWLFLKGFVFNTNLTHTLYSGLGQGFNQNFLLWNAGMGYKFLKDRSLELKLSVFDILNQNRSINRTITDTYIEDSQTNVLQQYFMLNITYTLRKFKG